MKPILTLFAVAAISFLASPSLSGDIDGHGGCKPAGCAEGCRAPACQLVCCPEFKTVTEKSTCWDVECEYVCIPPVQLPGFANSVVKRCSFGHCCTRHDTSSCEGCGSVACAACSASIGDSCQDTGIFNRLRKKLFSGRVRKVRTLKAVTSDKEVQVVAWKVGRSALSACKPCCGAAPAIGCGPCAE